MASSSPPRRRHSPAVYRRRRFVLLLAVIVVVAVIWLLVARPWSSAAEATGRGPAAPVASATPKQTATALPAVDAGKTPAPTATAGPSPSPTPSSATKPAPSTSAGPDVATCTATDLQVEALTDKDSYSASQKPKLSISLTNTGDQDCTLNVGTSTQKFTISSGNDVWWRSTDCQTKPSDQVVLLAAGQTVESATPIAWDRTRSSVKTCAATTRTKAPGGGASYHLAVEIGGVASDSTKQFLLR
jgi:hypothetical protein